MDTISVENKKYLIKENYKSCFNKDDFQYLYTDYFYEFDYILGDYSYNKLRLKGFYKSNNKKTKPLNDIKNLKKYLKDYCSEDCGYFLLEKE